MLESKFIKTSLEEIHNGEVAVRDGIFDEVMKRRMYSKQVIENNISVMPELQSQADFDSGCELLCQKLMQKTYKYTESLVVINKLSTPFPTKNNRYSPDELPIEVFKVISAAGNYVFSSYLSQRYGNWFGEFEELEGNCLDGLLVLMEQEKRFFNNMLVALTDEEYEAVEAQLIINTGFRKKGAQVANQNRKNIFQEVDCDIRNLATAWWDVCDEIPVKNLASEIDTVIGYKDYGLPVKDPDDNPSGIPKTHAEGVVGELAKELKIKGRKGRPSAKFTVRSLEAKGNAPKDWKDFKKKLKK